MKITLDISHDGHVTVCQTSAGCEEAMLVAQLVCKGAQQALSASSGGCDEARVHMIVREELRAVARRATRA